MTQQHIERAAERLAEEFAGVFSKETISRYMAESSDMLGEARVNVFVPVLAHRFTRERLRLWPRRRDHHKEEPEVLFVCVHNAGRSQMAAGLREAPLAGERPRPLGWKHPADEVNPAVVAAMSELGVDMSEEYPKPLTDEVVRAADVVITMGCGDACPIYPGKRYEDWELDDPADKDIEAVRRIETTSTSACSASSPTQRRLRTNERGLGGLDRSPLLGCDHGDLLREHPAMALEILDPVVPDADVDVLGLGENRRARLFRPLRNARRRRRRPRARRRSRTATPTTCAPARRSRGGASGSRSPASAWRA